MVGLLSPLASKDRVHRGVPPPGLQMDDVPQRSFEGQPSAPQNGRRPEVARVAGPLNALHCRVRKRKS